MSLREIYQYALYGASERLRCVSYLRENAIGEEEYYEKRILEVISDIEYICDFLGYNYVDFI